MGPRAPSQLPHRAQTSPVQRLFQVSSGSLPWLPDTAPGTEISLPDGVLSQPREHRAAPGQRLLHLRLHEAGFEPTPRPCAQKTFTGGQRGPGENPPGPRQAGRELGSGRRVSPGSHGTVPKTPPGFGASCCPVGPSGDPPEDPPAHRHSYSRVSLRRSQATAAPAAPAAPPAAPGNAGREEGNPPHPHPLQGKRRERGGNFLVPTGCHEEAALAPGPKQEPGGGNIQPFTLPKPKSRSWR